jgi:DNA-binding transcriptional LysR family regulator
MNIEHIKTFLEIAATGNFNRAAEHLNVTQSTASARIRALEDRLDRTLFVRGRNGASMTAAGHRFHRYALSAVRAWEQARQETALPEGYRAYLGLGSQVSLWERLILKWIPWMRREAPDVALRPW